MESSIFSCPFDLCLSPFSTGTLFICLTLHIFFLISGPIIPRASVHARRKICRTPGRTLAYPATPIQPSARRAPFRTLHYAPSSWEALVGSFPPNSRSSVVDWQRCFNTPEITVRRILHTWSLCGAFAWRRTLIIPELQTQDCGSMSYWPKHATTCTEDLSG